MSCLEDESEEPLAEASLVREQTERLREALGQIQALEIVR